MGEWMKRTLVVTGLIIVMGLMANCAKEESAEAGDPVEQAWEAMVESYNELETAQDKTELFEDFLREHPDTAYAGRLASSVAYYRGNELGDPEGAYSILAETLAKNTDPEARYEIGTAMFPLAVEIGESMDLGAVAEELAATRELSFGEMIDVADLALEHDQWELGATYAEAAMAKATPEAFLADYPDDDYSADEAAAKAERRKAMSLADLGWALFNLGEAERAMAVFEEATQYKTTNYLGVTDTDVDLYHGKALLAGGDAAGAMELFAPAAVMGSDDDAMTGLEEAFVAINGSTEGLDDWLWTERQRLARKIDDFTLADYDGVSHDFSAVSDGKVTLLAFWFPT
jgi:tetratricopeptide (TPR) repeat protein